MTKQDSQPSKGTWSWLKEYTGYIVTVLPYVSAGLVLIPQLSVTTKAVIIGFFACLVLYVRIWHEKAGIAVEDKHAKQKRP